MILIKETKKLDEAFKSGSAGKVIGLFVKVLGKRIGRQLMVSPYPYNYVTSEGKFSGFYCMFPNGKQALRVNFALKNSDIIHSVDFFKTPGRNPDLKIYLDGLNIIQILKTVEDAIKGHVEAYEESSIKEAVRPEDLELETWFRQNVDPSTLKSIKGSVLYGMYSNWCRSEGKTEAKNAYGKLLRLVKAAALDDPRLVPQEISLGRVETTAPIDRPLINQASAAEFSEIQNEVDDHLKKYEMLEHYLKIIASKNQPTPINGLFLAGKAGIGKTSSVRPILKALGTKFASYTGSVAGFTALYQLLWKHSSSDPVDVIIFDDCDSILNSEAGVNLLKGAMDSVEDRKIDYVKSTVESVLHEIDEPAEDGPVTLADFGAPVNSVTTIAPSKAPNSFSVVPRIIFISNLPKVPKPIVSRCLNITFNFTEEQVWDLMFDNLDNIIDPTRRAKSWESIQGITFRKLTKEDAKEVMLYCKSLKAGVDVADFRQVNFALTIWASCNDDSWKKWVRLAFRRL